MGWDGMDGWVQGCPVPGRWAGSFADSGEGVIDFRRQGGEKNTWHTSLTPACMEYLYNAVYYTNEISS